MSRQYIVLLGVPGAGKGTQAARLEEKLGLPQISTGDIFRYNLMNDTELGLLAKKFMDCGDLVPDDVTIRMVEDRLQQDDCRRGAILDGFPRNLIQAESFRKMAEPYGGVSVAPLVHIDDEEAISRVSGRRVCRKCGTIYNVDFNPPKQDGLCDIDGGELYQREDDKPETVRNRLFVYYKQTAPLIGYYFAHSLLVELNGARSIDEVTAELLEIISERQPV